MKLPGKFIEGEYHYKAKISFSKPLHPQIAKVIKEFELVRKAEKERR